LNQTAIGTGREKQGEKSYWISGKTYYIAFTKVKGFIVLGLQQKRKMVNY
jgi:hypothetical protein